MVYNERTSTYPTVIMANMFRFRPAEFFDAEPEAHADMRVSFGAPLVMLLLTTVFLFGCSSDNGGNGDHMMGDELMDNMGHMASPGVVEAKPAGATQVNVTLREWSIASDKSSVKAGKIYFLAKNAGPDHPHEMVIIRTDLGPLDLPFTDNKVPEDKVAFVDEIAEYAPNSSASLTVDLTPGKYLLICNITESDQKIGSHYKKGMVARLTVE